MIVENGFLIKTVDGFTEEMFFDLCQANSELRMERDQYGDIIIMPLASLETGAYNADLSGRFSQWNRAHKLGYAFDSSTGFTLANGAVRSPDLSWMTNKRWHQLPQSEKDIFAHICPDFVVEIRSETDRLNTIKAKMVEYRDNGCRLGWLIDRPDQAVHIYRADGSIEKKKGEPVMLYGENVLPGLELELSFQEILRRPHA